MPANEIASTLSALAPLRAESGQPLHRLVEARLRSLAALPEFQDGALLPDELTIASRLGVSRGTARAALARLVQEGVLERKAGIGTRVARPRAESAIGAWRSFSREMAAQGIEVVNFSQDYGVHRVSEHAAIALQVSSDTPLLRLDRVRGWGGQPVLYSRSWFHPRLRLAGTEDFSKPLYDVIEAATGVVADTAREEFSGVVATAALAKKLAIKSGTPLLLRSHTVSDARKRPIEYAEVHYVSSRFTLTLDLRREPS
ncbi:GntR family transcriptional regulator [Oleiharenicola lentus]|uniref:GntR family transcriptional regulator n=1 Tax=Oleiharenicola lentus TaxID=2508720 RepID=UPI003F667FFD